MSCWRSQRVVWCSSTAIESSSDSRWSANDQRTPRKIPVFSIFSFSPLKFGDFSDYYLNDPLNVAWIFTSAAIGMCVGPLPLYYVYKFDTRWNLFHNFFLFPISTRNILDCWQNPFRIVYFVYSLLAVLSSGLYPLADSFGFWPVAICRFFAVFLSSVLFLPIDSSGLRTSQSTSLHQWIRAQIRITFGSVFVHVDFTSNFTGIFTIFFSKSGFYYRSVHF